jgi:hypothetical protein
MSVMISTAVWQNAGVGGSELLVLVAIADIANDDGVAFISYGDLSAKVRLSERQSIRVVKKLVADAQLEIIQRGGTIDDRRFANVYRVTPHRKTPDILSAPDAHDTGEASDAGVSTPLTPTSQQTSWELKDSLRESSPKEETAFWRTSAAVVAVFTEWVSVAQPPRKNLSPSRERAIRKLLGETQDVEFAKKAVRGYVARRKSLGKSVDFADLVSTGPNTGSLGSRVDHFASFDTTSVNGSSPRIPDGVPDLTRNSLRALLGELEEAERTGDEQWMQRNLNNVPPGFQPVKDDGRWKIVRA